MKTKLSHTEIQEVLHKAGLKATLQRIVIYKALMSTHEHPAAESLWEVVKEEFPSISLATVYKTLDSFVDAGLAARVVSNSNSARYDGFMDHHHHLFSANTGELIDFEDEHLNHLIEAYLKSKEIKNFKISDFKVLIQGDKINPKNKVVIS